jgi:WD40 repeat protein/DNA-binding SARP family transcriptional activator
MGVAGIALLGPLVVDGAADRLGPRDRIVLAALALRPGDVISSERLADVLWGDIPPPSWNKVVPGCVMRLRRVLGTGTIETTPHGYRLVLPADAVDAHRFERLVGRGRELLTLGEPERASHVLGEALALWRGRALVDLEGWDTGRIEAARLEELRRDAEELRIDAALRAGRYREVLGEAQARVAEAPLRERRWALLALAQYQAGRQGEALRTLHGARTALATELGVDPGPDLVSLEQAILCQDPGLIAGEANPAPSTVCPYRGLVAYDVGDAESFFGRDAEIAECVRRLAAAGALVVVGPSGSGKSSLLRAGVVPALVRDGRRVVVVTPGVHPNDALTTVENSGPGVVVVVDQLEEAASLCDDPAERDRFLVGLAAHADRAPIALAVRADRLADVSSHPGVARVVERGLYLLGAMDEADLRACIEGPAHQSGLLLEPGLVDLLVREVEGEPGALPLLSHAMRETWERREGRTLTAAGYRDSGGIRGAVAKSAEAIYERVPPEQRPMLRDLLLRLVAPAPDGEPLRNAVPRRTLAADADHERLIELLVAARLVTSDDGVVELAHEALARAWPRLRGWLDDDVEGQRMLRHLTGAADAWDVMGRPDAELYRGARLTRALEWQARSASGLTQVERAFLDASNRLAAAERRAAEDHARHERRTRRRQRVLVIGVALLLVAAVVGGVVAVRQGQRADTATAAADARAVGHLALTTDDIDRSLLLAVEAMRLEDSADTRADLLAAVSRVPALVAAARHDEPVGTLDVSPDDGTVAVGGEFNGIAFLDAERLEPAGALTDPITMLRYRPDGNQLAVASRPTDPNQAAVRLLDPATLEAEPAQPEGFPEGQVEPTDLAYAGDGRSLVVSFGAEPSVLVWRLRSLDHPIRQIETAATAVALSRDGDVVYVRSDGPPSLTVYDVASGDVVGRVELADANGDGLEISPDGATLAVPVGNEVVLLDATTLTERAVLRGHTQPPTTLRFSQDGSLLAAASGRKVIVWDVAGGTQRHQFGGLDGRFTSLAFSPDDTSLYAGSDDRAVLAWDLGGARWLVRRTAQVDLADPGADVAVPAPDGKAVAYLSRAEPRSGAGDAIRLLDVDAGRLAEATISVHGSAEPAWRPPNGDQLATGGQDGVVRVWDRNAALVAQRQVTPSPITAVAYTSDGARLLVGDDTGGLHQLDAETLDAVAATTDVDDKVRQLVASPDRGTVFVLVDGAMLVAIDATTGEPRFQRYLGFDAMHADISPDGRVLAIVCNNGQVAVVDAETGRWIKGPTSALGADVRRVAFAPDGEAFATSGASDSVGMWDGRTGDQRGAGSHAGEPVWSAVEFLPDGHTAVVATVEGAIYTFDTRPERWIDHACRVAGRNLTDDEWRAVFGDRAYHETCADPSP